MDKHERYDPEDLESLLSERSFDELLPEERAFVLRHVADGTEYAALRATLGRIRSLPHEPLEADPDVRDAVLSAFREAHRPRFTIWLNSIGAWLLPPTPALWWRPALALATAALVVGVAVWLLEPATRLRHQQVAEWEVPRATGTMEEPQAGDSIEAVNTATGGPTERTVVEAEQAQPPAPATPASTWTAQEDALYANADADTEQPLPLSEAQDHATGVADMLLDDTRTERAQAPPAMGTERYEVAATAVRTREGQVAKSMKLSDAPGAVADPMPPHADLFSLLHAAW